MKILAAFIILAIASCSSRKEVSESLLENLENVYYQKWVAGVQGGGSEIHFHVIFKEPLNKEQLLEKVQFETYEAIFEKISETKYLAKINTDQNDLNLDEDPVKEYGNKAPEESLKINEANLYFRIKGKEVIKNLQNVKEKPMIAFPSMNKQKN